MSAGGPGAACGKVSWSRMSLMGKKTKVLVLLLFSSQSATELFFLMRNRAAACVHTQCKIVYTQIHALLKILAKNHFCTGYTVLTARGNQSIFNPGQPVDLHFLIEFFYLKKYRLWWIHPTFLGRSLWINFLKFRPTRPKNGWYFKIMTAEGLTRRMRPQTSMENLSIHLADF